jgi:uncharacterized protein (TIGR02301 family)
VTVLGRTIAFALAATLVIGPLGAAPAPPAKPAATPAPAATPTPTPTETAPPYEPQLLRLAELMGALFYLRDLCQAGDGAEFRDKMARLLEAEAHTEERKATLAGAFNRGFGDYSLTYRSCTPTAREVISSYLDESARIARDIASRYGG